MRKIISSAIIAGVLFPSLTLAQAAGVSGNANAGAGVSAAGIEVRANVNASATSSVAREQRGNATSSARSEGQRGDDMKNDSRENATTAKPHPAWGEKGGLVGFLRAVFGMSASSSTQDVHAAISASSTTEVSGNGLGFWARLKGFFRIN